jgi:threonine dehydratase
LSVARIEHAADELRKHLRPTPLQRSRALSGVARCNVFLKLESVQPIRSFKLRGALYKLSRLSAQGPVDRVITASAGNHGMGVAYAAAEFGVKATVFVPENANPLKVEAIRHLGATVVRTGHQYSEAFDAALAEQARTGAALIHAYDDPDVIAGQGTVGLEVLEDLPDVDVAVVGVGGGGLIGGVALYLKSKRPSVRVIGVEPTGADAMKRSLDAGRVETLDRIDTIADGLAASAPSPLTFHLAERLVDEMVTVSDAEMLVAIRRLFALEHLLAEPAGAAALAGLITRVKVKPEDKVAVILSGANATREVILDALGPA